jgi:stage V sporulation protein G
VKIIGHEAVKGRGTLIALAIVEVDIAGVLIRIQGVEIHQSKLGKLTIAAPQFRAANGKRHAAVILPPEIMRTAIELFVQQHMRPAPH